MIARIYNVNMAVGGTEYSLNVPANTKRLLINTRMRADDLKLAYATGESSTNFITIPAGSTKTIEGGQLSSLSDLVLYFQSATPDIVEVECWI